MPHSSGAGARADLNRALFTDYLNATVGRLFDPPLHFRTVAIANTNTFSMINNQFDFALVNGALAACQLQAADGGITAIATQLNPAGAL